MKTYKVKIAWEGVKVGEVLNERSEGVTSHVFCTQKRTNIFPNNILPSILQRLGFIEEVGAVKKKFVPKKGQTYFFLDSMCIIRKTKHGKYTADKMYISIGNCYRTEVEALEVRERVLKSY